MMVMIFYLSFVSCCACCLGQSYNGYDILSFYVSCCACYLGQSCNGYDILSFICIMLCLLFRTIL